MQGPRYFSALSVVCGLLGMGCGGNAPPPKVVEDEPAVESPKQPETVEVGGEVGGLNESQVTAVFQRCMSGLQQCLSQGARRVEYLGGDVGFFVEVDHSGALANAYVEQSTLGDRDTEKCMLGVLKTEKWPAPVGGKRGQAHKSFSFDPPKDVRPPVDWSEEDVKRGLAKLGRKLSECKNGENGTFTATLYVDTTGKPLAAGVAPPSARAESAADCIAQVLMAGKYPRPGSWAAKASFQL